MRFIAAGAAAIACSPWCPLSRGRSLINLIEEAANYCIVATNVSEAAAAYIAQGEQQTAALLGSACSLDAASRRACSGAPRDRLDRRRHSSLESTPISVDATALGRLWPIHPILVIPGFYGVDSQGCTALFGRGGSDLSALFLASALHASARLLKDVSGVYDADPASTTLAHRFTALSWRTAIEVAGPLIQAKALRHAQSRALPFYVGRPNERACTMVGTMQDQWEAPPPVGRPLRVVLLGCGTVGRGVYEMLKCYPRTFEICHVVVGDVEKHPDIPERTADHRVASINSIDIVVECFGGSRAALSADRRCAGTRQICCNRQQGYDGGSLA